MGKIVAVCSGCGGAGKSTTAVSLAVGAAKRGKQTILLDASGTSRACDLMLGMESVVVIDMLDVAKHQASIQTALYRVPGREHLQFACASLYAGASMNELSGVLLALRTMCDMLVIDLPTGSMLLGNDVLDADDALVLLTMPNDISLRAVERLVSEMGYVSASRHLVINHANAAWIKKQIQYDARTVEMLLDMPVTSVIAEDERIALCMGKKLSAIEIGGKTAAPFFSLLDEVL